MVPALIILLIAFSLLLIKSADLLVVSLRRLSRQTKTGVFALSALLLALGTSFPELFVGITSAIEKAPNLSLGVVLGSNIANISLVAGLTAFITGRVVVQGDFLKRDVLIAFIAGILPILLVLDGKLGRVDGLILMAAYGAYATSLFRGRYLEIAGAHKKESFVYRFVRQFNHINSKKTKEFGRLFIGIALLLFSADMIVKLSTKLATIADIPIFVIGLIVIAVGTSLPELAFSFRSLKDHEPSMFFGNLLGSTIANSTLVVGATSFIHPIEVKALEEYIFAAITFIVVFLSYWLFIRTKHRLDRWEAALLVLFYVFFVVMTFI